MGWVTYQEELVTMGTAATQTLEEKSDSAYVRCDLTNGAQLLVTWAVTK